MKQKGFTLIELLVVVAIIGILAAVGVVAYSGYTSGAKTSSAKANHKSTIKYITTEVMKCEIGETSVMDGKLNCSSLTGVNIAKAAVDALADFKNPYNTIAPGVRSGFGYTVGQVNISSTGNVNNMARLNFMTCLKEPCSGSNIIEEFVYFQE